MPLVKITCCLPSDLQGSVLREDGFKSVYMASSKA